MTIVSRRVSYILPAPSDPPPLLSLPPLGERRPGHTSPNFVQKEPNSAIFRSRNPFADPFADPVGGPEPKSEPSHPRHCLGISSLALDASTVLANAAAPGGILYTGGRDGLVASWELGMPHRRRRRGRYEILPGRGGRVKWERIGDSAEMWADEEDEDLSDEDGESHSSDDEVEGDEGWVGVNANGERSRRAGRGEVSYEDRWEVNRDELARRKPPPTTFRQSAQTHTDWVNAMLLCNLNQTVITASSDRTIRAWSPHATSDAAGLSPTLVGRHRDYVRSLAWAKHPSLLFSGALDRTLAIWDVQAANPDSPLLSIDLNKADDYGGVGLEGERGSVYALGVDPAGKVLAAGTPERVVRLWDPRSGDKSIGKLVGHSDCVRSVVISEDGRYMLTGSSDSTIKLWSLAAHRCLHTFNHHTSSVWALHSDHPNLERFYSGSRDGHLCVVDLEQCTDISDGECVVLAREGEVQRKGDIETKSGDEGIRCITAMDDEFVWSATGSAEVKRWKDVGRKVARLTSDDDGVSYAARTSGDRRAPVSSARDTAYNSTSMTDTPPRNKQFSLEGAPDGSLPQSESREARSVAFASTSARNGLSQNSAGSTSQANSPPQINVSSSGDTPYSSPRSTTIRDRHNTPQQRLSTLSGASATESVMYDASANGDEGPLPISAHSDTLRGIPYQSLVCLGLPDSPYSFGFSNRQDDTHTLPSGGSMLSVPRGLGNLLKPDASGDSARPGSLQLEREQSQAQVARMEFEDREIASEAVPLNLKADEVIAGRSGLVRSILLNDRQHVLTVDTEGEVAAWNIIRGVCVGRFPTAEVAAALDLERGVKAETAVRKHSLEVLEMVRDRVEGETMVITWCQVDTKIGSLVVHLDEGRVFDAEVYADELEIQATEGMNEDSRINLGKWALANLFTGLIKAEERQVTSVSSNANASSGNVPTNGAAQVTIPRSNLAPSHRKRALTGSSTASAPILNIPGLAIPASTPAIPPDEASLSKSAPSGTAAWQSFQASRNVPLAVVPASPTVPISPIDHVQKGDYFSARRKADTSPSRGDEKVPSTPGIGQMPQTPGGSFMGKLKGLGKKKTAETPMSTVVESFEAPPEDKGPKMSERDSSQMLILDTVRAHPFQPPAIWEAPPLTLPPSTALLISEESKDAGAWVVTYRSQVSSTERDMESLEWNSPLWVLDYLFTSRTKHKEPVKLTFHLEPAPGSDLKEMPEGATRLSASRVLRARKLCAFVYDKLELGPPGRSRTGSLSSPPRITNPQRRSSNAPFPSQSQGGNANEPSSQVNMGDGDVRPEDVVELLCGHSVVDPKITLATLKQYYGSGGDMLVHYRLKGV